MEAKGHGKSIIAGEGAEGVNSPSLSTGEVLQWIMSSPSTVASVVLCCGHRGLPNWDLVLAELKHREWK